jgi:predicted kinase
VKAYDCIGHHIEELTEENVDNALIALNPANIQLVHFRCHNEIHKRFGYAERQVQKVYIVWGAPCSGKTTWVDGVAEPGDIVLDIDRLWKAIRAGSCGEYEKPNALKQNVFALRDSLLDQIKTRRGHWNNAYIIGGYPLQGERERLADMVGAERLIFIDTPEHECFQRASNISVEKFKFVSDWFEKFQSIPPGSF